MSSTKPKLSFWQIWNMSFGFMGIQFGFALQNGNASRILLNFGAPVEHLSWFWLVAPITGMIVQPIIGHYSDKTWNRLGRRKPYFLAGALLSCLALILLPNSDAFLTAKSALLIGAGMLMMMDASINVAMEPFRALVADNLPDSQRTLGFSIQTFLIGIGAVFGSLVPYILSEFTSIGGQKSSSSVELNVIYSFYIGAAVLLISILVTVFKTKEYPPEEYERYHGKPETSHTGFLEIFKDFGKMPKTMRQLGLVQFFSWFALFSMWVFTTPAIAQHIYHLPSNETSSAAFNKAGNWVGVLFSVYNGISAIYALLLPSIAAKIGRKATHAISLTAGGLGLLSMYIIQDPNMLIYSMVGIGLAWGSILSMPYAILAGSIPAGKMGVYMGIFNFFITLPQIVNGFLGGPIVKNFYNGQSIYAIVLAGVFMLCAAISVLYVQDNQMIRVSNKKEG